MILVDNSVWVEVLRKERWNPLLQVQSLAEDELATCLPVIQEVLQGCVEKRSFWVAHAALTSIAVLERTLTLTHFTEAAELYRLARDAGAQVRSGIDCLIAACAIRHDVAVLHRDRDYDKLAMVSKLKTRRI